MRRRAGMVASAATVAVLTACGTTTAEPETAAEAVATQASEAEASPTLPTPDAAVGDRAEGIEPAPGATPSAPKVPKAFRFAGTTIDGKEFEGADLAGRPTVFWFWAPWCSTCRNQIDQVRALTDAYADAEVAFVGVGGLDDASAMVEFSDEVKAPAMTQLSDPEGTVWRHFGTTAQSTFLVIDGDGMRIDSGFMSESDLNAAIKSALA